MKERDTPEYWVLDSLEHAPQGQLARLERADGELVVLPASVLPANTREGDVLQLVPGPDGDRLQAAPQETRRRRRTAQAHLNALNRDAPAAEIDL